MAENPHNFGRHLTKICPNHNVLAYFKIPRTGAKFAYIGLLVRYALGKGYCVFKIPPVHTKNQIITVSVFLCTLQLTALLSKNFHLLLHSYTIPSLGVLPPKPGFWFPSFEESFPRGSVTNVTDPRGNVQYPRTKDRGSFF